ncbi:MAG: hypothetical protein M3P70_09545, partial [Actinomycetota bacterium]|nr:hypothetical protein [Actinomycetota bacterium]
MREAVEQSPHTASTSAAPSDGGTSRSGRDVRAWARRHRVFLVALVVGLALRVVVVAAYQPALWFQGDSFSYVTRGVSLSVHSVRPMGYG